METSPFGVFGIMSDARAIANCSFPKITHISGKKFQILFAVKEGEIQTPNRALGQIQQQQRKQKFKLRKNDHLNLPISYPLNLCILGNGMYTPVYPSFIS